MTKETYIRMTQPFREHPKLANLLHRMNQMLTGIVVLSYVGLLAYLAWVRQPAFLHTVLVPLIGFVVVTVFRKWINRERPYERFDLAPVFPKDKKGQSFPSRHVYSAAIIAGMFFVQPPELSCLVWIGGGLVIVSLLMAVVRVISGIHYITDVVAALVLAGAAAGIIAGILR